MFDKVQGFVKLYAPNGAEVYLPFDPNNIRLLALYEQQGLTPVPPSEYERERRTQVGAFVVRIHINGDGSETPVVDVYFRHRNGYADRLRSMRVYLNTDRDIRHFESAFGVSLQSLPFYDSDTPIDRNRVRPGQEQYIHHPTCPVWVVWRLNPASENDEQAAKRLFIRWERGKCTKKSPNSQQSQPRPQQDKSAEVHTDESAPTDVPGPSQEPAAVASDDDEPRHHFASAPIVNAVGKVWGLPPAKVVPALYKAFGTNGRREISVAEAIAWAEANRPSAA